MSASAIELRGSLEIGAGACVSGCGSSGSRTIRALALRCAGMLFQSIVMTGDGSPLRIATAGALGTVFADLGLLDDLIRIKFLQLQSDQPIVLRLNAGPAVITGVGGVYPTSFVGAESLNLVIDGSPVGVIFLIGDQTAAQVAARINAAIALAGIATPRATVASSGQLVIDGLLTGPEGSVEVAGGTGAAQLGLTGLSATGEGEDVNVYGQFIVEFDPSNAPTRIQASGNAQLAIVAAGDTQ